MKKKRGIIILAALSALVFALTACGGGSGNGAANTADSSNQSADGATYTWKLATMGNDDHQITKTMIMFADEVRERTNGDIDIQVFANGQLGTSPDQVLGGIQSHVIEMGEISVNNCAEYTNAFIPMDAPYLFLTREQALNFVGGEAAGVIRDKVRAESGLELITFIDYGYRVISNSKRPIASVEDMKVIKIRTLSNQTHMKAFESAGALPTAMAFSEVYTALQQGTVDAQENPADTIYIQKFHEVTKYITVSNHLYSFDGLFMNAETFASLPEEHQQAIMDAAEAIRQAQYDMCIGGIEDALEAMATEGAEVNHLDDATKLAFQEAMAPAWDLAASICGQEYFDQIKALADAAA